MASKKTIDDVLNLIENYRQSGDMLDELHNAREAMLVGELDKVGELDNLVGFTKELSEIAMRDAKENIKLIAASFIVQLTQKTMKDIENIQDTQEMCNIAQTLKTCLELYERC